MKVDDEHKTHKAFVLIPLAEEFNSIFEQLIRPPLEDVGYIVDRADSLTDQQNILRDIIKGIATADLIIAEITVPNANVFYELGLAHGLRIPTVLMAQSMDGVPFDLRGYRVITYSTKFDKATDFKQVLCGIGRKHVKREIVFGSPVSDFLSMDLQKSIEDAEATYDSKGEVGILEVDKAYADLHKSTSVIIGEIDELRDAINPLIAEFEEISKRATSGTLHEARSVAQKMAEKMEASSCLLEKELPTIEEGINILTQFSDTIAITQVPRTGLVRNHLSRFRGLINGYLKNVQLVIYRIEYSYEPISNLALISTHLSLGSRRMVQVFDDFTSAFEHVEAICERVLQITQSKLDSEGR